MKNPISVLVPLLNPNELESNLVKLTVHEGQEVKTGDLLAVFETTKSTFDLEAESAGYIRGLRFHEGETCKAGDRFCYLAESASAPLAAEPEPAAAPPSSTEEPPEGLRITRPALELAKEFGIDLSTLPKGELVTEKWIRQMQKIQESSFDPESLLIYGGGGHAKSLIDLMRACGGILIAGIVDDRLPAGRDVLEVPVLGRGDRLAEYSRRGLHLAVNAVGGIGDIAPRLAVFDKLCAAHFTCPTLIHPRAYVESSAAVGDGCQVFFNAYVGSDTRVGFGCIVNTGAILSHDCVLGDYVNISPGAILAGAVIVEERTLVGMGVTVNLGVHIGAGARIGNSAVIKSDVPANAIVRAGSVWPEEKSRN